MHFCGNIKGWNLDYADGAYSCINTVYRKIHLKFSCLLRIKFLNGDIMA